ncbi:MAG: sigma-70 family RNA polymerase sigma factor [Verrucomicrobiota bacterium]
MPNGTESDEELLRRVRQDDEQALQRLVRRYQRRLGEFSHSMLRSRDLAEEAVANVFLSIWRRRERLAVKTTVRGYLFAATGNQSLKLLKERKRHATVWINDVHARHLIDPRSTHSEINLRELHDAIEVLVARMPPQRQLIFRLSRIEGLSYWEIAQSLKLSEHTVQNHMTQATRQLDVEWPKLRGGLEAITTDASKRKPASKRAHKSTRAMTPVEA